MQKAAWEVLAQGCPGQYASCTPPSYHTARRMAEGVERVTPTYCPVLPFQQLKDKASKTSRTFFKMADEGTTIFREV